MIEVDGLVKSFGPRVALAGVHLSLEAGESVSLVGPNGAGKTTLLRILAALTRPNAGVVRIAGLDPVRAGSAVRRRIGFMSHRTLLYDDLTVEQNLRFYARMYDLDAVTDRVVEILEQVGLKARRDDLVRTLSRGMQQRLALARTVLHRPQVLLLDEPYTGLDPQAARVLTGLVNDLAGEGRTILLTTHDLERGLAVGQRVVMLVEGRLVYDQRRDSIDPAAFSSTYETLATT